MRRLLLLGLLAATLACDRMVERQIAANFDRTRTDMLTSPDLQVVLCGTGSPLADANRASACTAVVAGGEVVLVDVGPGSWEVADLANLPTGALSAVLLTHFHSDHIGDLGEAITQSWIAGRPRPLDVYGPPGVAGVVDGFAKAYARDVDYRVAHHGEEALPRGRGARRRARGRRCPPTRSAPRSCSSATACASRCSASTTRRSSRPSAIASTIAAGRSSSAATPPRARA